MNALAKLPPVRPERMVPETFEGFRIGRDGQMLPWCEELTFEACRDTCAISTPHKAQFAVRVTDLRSGAVTLHVFQMRLGQRRYVVRDHVPQYVRDPRADEVSVIRLVEPTYPDEVARRVGLPVGRERAVANGAVL